MALAMFATPAAADTVSLRALAGGWVFETEAHRVTHCVIRGDAAAAPRGEQLAIRILAHESCPDGREWRAEEQCLAQLEGDVLNVSCTLVRATPSVYFADQFALHVVGATEMRGRLADGNLWNSAVLWRRSTGPLVS